MLRNMHANDVKCERPWRESISRTGNVREWSSDSMLRGNEVKLLGERLGV
jgi:hypothetical protein